MATIITTDLKVYSGTTTAGTQVGNTITKQGSPATVALDSTSLGVPLDAGEQYCVIARCANDEQYTTDWTQPYPFKTLIFAEIATLSGEQGIISPKLSFKFNNQVLTIRECGVYASTNASGANPQKIAASNQQEAEKGWVIKSLTENTTYYVIPFVIDDLGREYKGDWADAKTASTGYTAPAVNISNVGTTYNSISGNVNIATNDTLQSVKLGIIPTGGGSDYQYKTLTNTTGLQTWSVTNGDLDDQSNPIVINPSTEYSIIISAVNTSNGTGSATVTATTAQQSTETIAITGVTNITPTTAAANLSYGGGGEAVNPGQGE